VKAILLAAGIGSRLGHITASVPKCLLPINGRPLLDYWFERLRDAGVGQVFINLHYLPDAVRDFVDSRDHGLEIELSYEPTLLGSAGTIRSAGPFIGEDDNFLIIYADNFALIDLNRLIKFHESKNNPILTLVAYPTDRPRECGIIELDGNNRVVSFEEKPMRPNSNLANSGIHVASRNLFSEIPDQNPCDVGYHVLPKLVGRMYGYVTEEYIKDIGTPESYRDAQQMRAGVN
jgi:mannose-1-phosphate guanylyltransferase